MPSNIDGFGWFVREPEKSTVFRLMEVPADPPTVLDPTEGQPYPLWDGASFIPVNYVKPDSDPTEALFKGSYVMELARSTELDIAKAARYDLVKAIVVTTQSGKQFDGDEDSQSRMARAIASLDDGETITWVLADNAVVLIGRGELREALRLAGAEMSRIWVAPYTGRNVPVLGGTVHVRTPWQTTKKLR